MFGISKEQKAHQKFKRQTRKLVFKQYDGFLKLCKSTAKAFGTERIPLKNVNEFLDMCKVETNDISPAVQDRINLLNSTFDTMKNVCRKQSESTIKDGRISIAEIEKFVQDFKDTFVEAQNKDIPTKKS